MKCLPERNKYLLHPITYSPRLFTPQPVEFPLTALPFIIDFKNHVTTNENTAKSTEKGT